MSAVATEAAAVVRRPHDEPAAAVKRPNDGRSAQRLFEPSEVTLEDSILGAWEALRADGRAECPVCHAELAPSGCKTCGAQLG